MRIKSLKQGAFVANKEIDAMALFYLICENKIQVGTSLVKLLEINWSKLSRGKLFDDKALKENDLFHLKYV